ncbi:hypothetical protein KCU81_g4139, partial [Aureobasidium melanogenum]|uniref:Uncharacterized protein n=1 Tax=Aureobasidium melanogenum (strain CBS 110374) TaxID=1043003 RepID=A0A074WD37_AURM1
MLGAKSRAEVVLTVVIESLMARLLPESTRAPVSTATVTTKSSGGLASFMVKEKHDDANYITASKTIRRGMLRFGPSIPWRHGQDVNDRYSEEYLTVFETWQVNTSRRPNKSSVSEIVATETSTIAVYRAYNGIHRETHTRSMESHEKKEARGTTARCHIEIQKWKKLNDLQASKKRYIESRKKKPQIAKSPNAAGNKTNPRFATNINDPDRNMRTCMSINLQEDPSSKSDEPRARKPQTIRQRISTSAKCKKH